jgi:hypothetical protein
LACALDRLQRACPLRLDFGDDLWMITFESGGEAS